MLLGVLGDGFGNRAKKKPRVRFRLRGLLSGAVMHLDRWPLANEDDDNDDDDDHVKYGIKGHGREAPEGMCGAENKKARD